MGEGERVRMREREEGKVREREGGGEKEGCDLRGHMMSTMVYKSNDRTRCDMI